MAPARYKTWLRYRNSVLEFQRNRGIDIDHTDDAHVYIDTAAGVRYDTSASRIISLMNTEGYAQRNARSIIAQIYDEYNTFTDDTIEHRLCSIMHVSTDKLEATGIGNEVHRLLDRWNTKILHYIDEHGEYPVVRPNDIIEFARLNSYFDAVDVRVEAALSAYENFILHHEVLPVASELPLVSTKYKTGGTIDFLGMVDGKLTLIDYKTGKLKAEHWLQQALYAQMLQECVGIQPSKLQIWLFKPSMKDIRYTIEHIQPLNKINTILRKCIQAHTALEGLRQLRKK